MPLAKETKRAIIGVAIASGVGLATAAGAYLASQQGGHVATVDGKHIPASEYNLVLEGEKRRATGREGIDFKTAEGKKRLEDIKKQVLEQLIERQLVLNEAEKRGIKVTDDEVSQEIDKIKNQYFGGDQAKFTQELTKTGWSLSFFRGKLRQDLAGARVFEAVTQDVKASDAEAKKFYQDNKTMFSRGEEVQASHILVKTEAEAKKLREELLKGADFASLAKKHSTDPGSGQQGGDLGYFGKGRMVPEFEKAAFALKINEISQPVKTQFGYHLIKKTGQRPPSTQSFDEVKDQIRQQIANPKKQAKMQDWLAKAKQQAKIEKAEGQ